METRKYNTALIIIVVSLVAIALFINYEAPSVVQNNPSSGGKSSGVKQPVVYEPATEEDFARLEEILPQNEIIQKLPSNARILLRFYNFDSGDREWEKAYILTTGSAVQGYDENVDMILIIHSKYLSRLNANNFCTIINSAKSNGDFGAELKTSTASLLWKYKSVVSYRDCLGF